VSILFIFTTAYVVALSGALMPGPLMTVIIKESLQQGWRTGFLISAGHGLAEVTLLALFGLGLNRLLRLQWVPVAIGIVGGLVLLYMGVEICRSVLKGAPALDFNQPQAGVSQPVGAFRLSPVKSGLIATVANPYWVLWWFTIGILYVTQALHAGILGLGLFYTGHFLADLSWCMIVAIAAATGKRFLSPIAYQGILVVCGVFLVALAAYFIYQGSSTATLLLRAAGWQI